MSKPKLAVIGNGMAGIRTVEELLKLAPDKYEITVFGAEPHPNYNRILLSPVLAGEQTLNDIVLNDWDWYRDNGITLITNKKIVEIHRTKRELKAETGETYSYDRLLIATGSNPFILPIPGANLPGVISYRDIADTEAMIEAAKHHKKSGCDRRRPARARSGKRAQTARDGRHRRARDALAHGATTRRTRG